jgi:hypothetical protein
MSEIETENEIETVPFWGTDPNILFKEFEFFPVDTMTYEEKLNAVTRGIIVLSIVSFAFTKSVRTLIISIITILAIFAVHHYGGGREGLSAQEVVKEANPLSDKFLGLVGNTTVSVVAPKYKKLDAELPKSVSGPVQGPADIILDERKISKDGVFGEPESSNPFGNFMISDYKNNPHKKPAPPAFNESVNNRILAEAKAMVAELNPGQPDISDKLFKDLGEQYVFEQSLRQFTSNPSTTLVNDQTGFADFCYGSMTSCKEGNLFACARNLPRHMA